MGYKIAVATSDGIRINRHFGETDRFVIYRVEENDSYQILEIRQVPEDNDPSIQQGDGGCGGCGGRRRDKKIAGILDCRCVLCARCGFGSEKELQKAGITVFAIEKEIEEAMIKIIQYYRNHASHVSLIRNTDHQAGTMK